MYARQITSEEVLERKQLHRVIEMEKETKVEERTSIARKLLGIICIIICILTPIACNGDCTFWFVMIPCAVYFFVDFEDE